MYILPRPYVCPECKAVFNYGPHDPHPSPVFANGPTCPKCWEDFVRSRVPVMNPVPQAARPIGTEK